MQVYIAFLVSGLVHLGGEYSVIGYWTYRHALQFFLSQAVAITLEVIVIEGLAMRFSIRGLLWQCIGYLWVIMWFTYTVPGFIDPLLRGGLAETAPFFGILSAFIGS